MTQELETAVVGDSIRVDGLQLSVDMLRVLAASMDKLMTDELSVPEMQSVGRAQVSLRAVAGSLVNRQITLLAGEARITAEHINSAVMFANGSIDRVAALKEKLAKVAALVEFLGAATTGNGKAIVQAAVTLKGKLG